MTWGTGRITNQEGIPFMEPVSFKQSQPECERESFNSISREIRKTVDEQTYLVGDNLTNSNFYLDQLGFTKEFQTCLAFVSELLVTKETNVVTNTSECFPTLLQEQQEQDRTDPCCFPQLQWSTPCESRDIHYNLSRYQPDEKTIDQICSDPECTSTYVVDLGRAQEILENPLEGCRAISFESLVNDTTTWIPYKECRARAMGANLTTGIYCRQDSDCYSGHCDLLNRRCIIPVEEQEMEFIRCITKSLSLLVMFQIKDEYGISAKIGTGAFARQLKDIVSAPDCVGDSDFALGYRDGTQLKFALLTAECADSCSPQQCPDIECDVPIVCRQISSRTCYKKFVSCLLCYLQLNHVKLFKITC